MHVLTLICKSAHQRSPPAHHCLCSSCSGVLRPNCVLNRTVACIREERLQVSPVNSRLPRPAFLGLHHRGCRLPSTHYTISSHALIVALACCLRRTPCCHRSAFAFVPLPPMLHLQPKQRQDGAAQATVPPGLRTSAAAACRPHAHLQGRSAPSAARRPNADTAGPAPARG